VLAEMRRAGACCQDDALHGQTIVCLHAVGDQTSHCHPQSHPPPSHPPPLPPSYLATNTPITP
jgi:hypothetical protein